MAQKVTMFKSDSGKSFDSEHDALRDDLHHMLIKSGHINDASATAFVEWACKPRDNLSGLGSVLKSLYDTHPEAPTTADPLPVTPPAYPPHACDFKARPGAQLRQCTVCHREEPLPMPPAFNRSPTDNGAV